MTTVAIDTAFPLSPLQQGILFHTLEAPGSGMYVLQTRSTCEGPLDVGTLVRAWQLVLQRHQALRAAFVWEDVDAPWQVIGRHVRMPFACHDWRGMPARRQQQLLDAWAARDRVNGFVLSRAPLMRLFLIRTADESFEMIWTCHHIIVDGWSRAIVLEEVSRAYEAFVTGTEPHLPAPMPYSAYVARLPRDLRAAERFWRAQLGDVTAPTALGLDAQASGEAGEHAQGRVDLRLPVSDSTVVQDWCRRHAVSLATFVTGAWALVVSRYSGQPDVVCGMTVSGRHAAAEGIERLVGLCMNTLPVRARVSGAAPARAWLAALQQQCAETREYEYTPLSSVQQWTGVARGVPLFESLVVFENFPIDDAMGRRLADRGGVRIHNVRGHDRTNYPLLLVASPGVELPLSVAYDTGRLSASAATRLLAHLASALTRLTAHDDVTLDAVSLLTDEERREIVETWSVGASVPTPSLLIDALRAQAVATPDAVAVVDGDAAVSYATLHARARQLGERLQAAGVAPESPVAVCMDASLALIEALLGVWLAGGAYVPLDPRLPPDRLAFLLADVGASIVITDTSIERRGPAHQPSGTRVAIAADTLAYVIYTSGSTGQPKGVAITHGNVSSLFAAGRARLTFTTDDVWTWFHSASFDFSVWEIWGALQSGGRLVVVPYATARTPEAFHALLRREQVTVLNQTPSAFARLQEIDADTPALSLRVVIFGGAALDPRSLRGWVARHGCSTPRLINMYGITETTVHVTHHVVTQDEVTAPAGSIVGRALPAWRTYVLDRAGQPVPVGVAGELFVGGAGLARDYVGRPDLTASRFVPDPFSATPGARLYRTGDRARWRADGLLDYVGRIDHQIKLRGYRIEPGEIEAILRQQQGVRDALVRLHHDRASGEDEPLLVAYVVERVATDDEEARAARREQWMKQLRATLPDYMVPSAIVTLDAWPLTVNGKIDRLRLPAPGAWRRPLDQRFVPPRTPAEATLAAIWAEVLRVDRVGIEDNFFALGGDSMRVIQVQGKARQRGLALSIEHVMRYQTIAELARHAESVEEDEGRRRTQPFDLAAPADRDRLPPDVDDAYPLTELQAGMLFHSELDPSNPVYHDLESFRLRMACDPPALRAALVDIMTAHPILRTSLHLTGYSQPLQLVHHRCEPPLSVHDLSSDPEQEVRFAQWLDRERRRSFDWTTAPLFRLHVHQRSGDDLQCTLVCHHAILDGWSVASFLSELVKSYVARLSSIDAPPTPAPRITFRDYVALEVDAARSEAAREYWIGHVGDLAPTVTPRSRPGGPDEGPRRIVSQATPLPVAVSAGLHRLAADAGVPLKSVLLAGHLRVMAFVANQDEVVTGLVAHGRTGEADADRVLGLFLSTMPFRCRVRGVSWSDLARRIFEIECAHARHRHFPMAILRRLTGRRDLYDGAFNVVNFHVYHSIRRVARLDILGGHSVAETEMPLLAQCGVDDGSGQIDLRLDVDATQFAPDHATRLLAYYERAYAACAADPRRPCVEASLLSPAEWQQVVVDWNPSALPVPGRLAPKQVIAQAQRQPMTPAVVADEGTLTYAQLVAQAHRVAAVLRRHHVGPDVSVGLCMPRSLEAMTALLGTLLAAGAYVPLDPAHPDERLRTMIADSRIAIALTTSTLAPRVAALVQTALCVETLDVDADGSPFEGHRHVELLDGEHLACVIYTSGSTGRPKGIGLRHQGLIDLIEWHTRRMGGGARTLQFASLGFDVSLLEIAATWCSGGTLFLVPEPVRADAAALGQYLHKHAIAQATLPVVSLQQLAEACVGAERLDWLRSLRRLITTGERLQMTAAVAHLLGALPDCTFHNHYGPAETHVWVTAHDLAGDPTRWPVQPPIGRAMDTTRAYVLDRDFAPVPPNTPGELCIGGSSLARGYHHRPDLTAERFLPDPFSAQPGGRCYRTGDLARWSLTGELEYLGRRDHQVKIRGHRIEPGEVEMALMRQPHVRQALVIPHEYAPGDTRLVAYIIPADETRVDTRPLRDALARVLPDAMLPAAFIVVDSFPLNRNGKIDRHRLPSPETEAACEGAAARRPPDTPAARFVAAVYAELLRVDPDTVGLDDSFFDRGGHSLLATQAVVRLREAFGLEIPLRTLFERPTVAGMVAALGDMVEDRALLDDIATTVFQVETLSDADVQARLSVSSS